MKNILETLYNGGIEISSTCHVPNHSEAITKKHALQARLEATLTKEQSSLFEEYRLISHDMEHAARYKAYIETLKFAICFMSELFLEED